MDSSRWIFRFLNLIKQNLKVHVCLFAICALFFAFYREVSGRITAIIVLTVLISYAVIMALCTLGTTRILQYERAGTLTRRRAIGYSFLVAAPVYFFWMLFSLIPIIRYEIWMLTGFPLCVVTFFTLVPVAERWHKMRLLFWLIQIGIYLTFLLLGQQVIEFLIR